MSHAYYQSLNINKHRQMCECTFLFSQSTKFMRGFHFLFFSFLVQLFLVCIIFIVYVIVIQILVLDKFPDRELMPINVLHSLMNKKQNKKQVIINKYRTCNCELCHIFGNQQKCVKRIILLYN